MIKACKIFEIKKIIFVSVWQNYLIILTSNIKILGVLVTFAKYLALLKILKPLKNIAFKDFSLEEWFRRYMIEKQPVFSSIERNFCKT